MTLQNNRFRWAAIALALGLGIVACSTPTTTELELGQQVRFTVPSDPAAVDAGDELMKHTREIVASLEQRPGLEVASVDLRGSESGTTLDLVMWGENLDAHALVRDLVAQYPVLQGAAVDVTPLHSEVREPLYAKLSRKVLNIEVGGGTDEEIRARILEQLHAGGFGEGSDVQVYQAEGRTTLQINAVGDGVVQEAVIEVVGDQLPESIELDDGAGDPDANGRVIIERVKKQ